jgi:hypothetical protein
MKSYSWLKYSWLIPIVGIVIALIVLFSSCTPDHDEVLDFGKHDYLNYEFSVGDQVNVKQYEIEVSVTGNVNESWDSAGLLFANIGGLTHNYTMQVDVTHWFKKTNVLYSRIKSVDFDGKVMYSKIETTKYQ